MEEFRSKFLALMETKIFADEFDFLFGEGESVALEEGIEIFNENLAAMQMIDTFEQFGGVLGLDACLGKVDLKLAVYYLFDEQCETLGKGRLNYHFSIEQII
jgi:hypothetical protein